VSADPLLPNLNPYFEQSRCESKKAYSTKKIAVTVINDRTKGHQRHRPETGLRAYNCPHCNQWHITSLTKEKYNR
jgi:hypothetical protein